MGYSAYFGIAAVIVSALALVISVFGRSAIGRRGIAIAILALAAGGLTAYVPWHYRALARSVPPIDDITTDTDNPPAFVAVIKLREAEDGNPSTYAGAETAALQRRGYPDLGPLSLALAPAEAFPIALATAKEMSWTIAGRSHDSPHRGERAKLLDGLHRRHRRPGRRGGPREVASTCAPRRAMGAAILASTPPASAPTSLLCTRRRSRATKGGT
jgi:hypothetical protein